jgi:hypothetical protein
MAREWQLKSFESVTVQGDPSASKFGMSKEVFDGIVNRHAQLDDDAASRGGISVPDGSMYHGGLIIEPSDSDPRRGILGQSQRSKINELLGAWYVFVSRRSQNPKSLYLTNVHIGLRIAGRNQKMNLGRR